MLFANLSRPLKALRRKCSKQSAPQIERRDSLGRVCKAPDPTDNLYFNLYAEAHGVEAARAAFGLWE